MTSAEIRFFLPLPSDAAAAFAAWFGTGEHIENRTDVYALDRGTDIGAKERGGANGVEVKTLVSGAAAKVSVGARVATVQIWTKAASGVLSIMENARRPVPKKRRTLRFPGCNVEWTELGNWWTFGLEAIDVDALRETLLRLDATKPGRPELGDEWLELSYPAWLALSMRRP